MVVIVLQVTGAVTNHGLHLLIMGYKFMPVHPDKNLRNDVQNSTNCMGSDITDAIDEEGFTFFGSKKGD